MNQQQSAFIQRALQQLSRVINSCIANGSYACETLGRKRVGRHTVVVKLIAEIDRGFSAPLASHAMSTKSEHSSASQTALNPIGATPDYSKQTEHHNTVRGSRWHKPIF